MDCWGVEAEGSKEGCGGEGRGGWLKVEELERVGFGWTGPSLARRALRARFWERVEKGVRVGSEASFWIAVVY